MKPNREREAYCKYCGRYLGMVEHDYVCPICEEDVCDSKECYDKHHKECEVPYAKWIDKKHLKAKYPHLNEEQLEEAASNIMILREIYINEEKNNDRNN